MESIIDVYRGNPYLCCKKKKKLGLVSTFTPIGMLDLVWTLAPTPSVKWA
jgi:hypothetical protein